MAYHCINFMSKECDGCGGCQKHYYCPVCENEVVETVYVDNYGEVIGCENCVETKEPYEVFKNETD